MSDRICPILLLGMIVLVAGCGEPQSRITQGPASVRGWIIGIEGLNEGPDSVGIVGRHYNPYPDTNVYVPNVKFASGGLQSDGTFVILDIPHGDATLVFQAPGIDEAPMQIRNLPPNAELYAPGVRITRQGAILSDPSRAVVRIPVKENAPPREIPSTTLVNGKRIRTTEVYFKQMGDRMNYPQPGEWIPVLPGSPDNPNQPPAPGDADGGAPR